MTKKKQIKKKAGAKTHEISPSPSPPTASTSAEVAPPKKKRPYKRRTPVKTATQSTSAVPSTTRTTSSTMDQAQPPTPATPATPAPPAPSADPPPQSIGAAKRKFGVMGSSIKGKKPKSKLFKDLRLLLKGNFVFCIKF